MQTDAAANSWRPQQKPKFVSVGRGSKPSTPAL
jgi:hypothetical protein